MASGKHIVVADMPPELTQTTKTHTSHSASTPNSDWQSLLAHWVTERLAAGEDNILAEATPAFEKIVLQQALRHTHGHKQEAARKLGWGRNTLTRKLKELGVD